MRVSHRLGSSLAEPSSFWKEASPNTETTCRQAALPIERGHMARTTHSLAGARTEADAAKWSLPGSV